MTFDELYTEILSFPDCSVEITDIFVMSTHEFVAKKTSFVSEKVISGVDPRNDWDCKYAKKCFVEILNELENGRTGKLSKLTLDDFLK